MTQPVPTDGFNAPAGAPANVPASAPPPDAKPGFVPPAPAPAPATASADVAALTAALTAALAAQSAPASAAPAPVAGVVPGSIPSGDDPIIDGLTAALGTAVPGIDLERLLGKAIEYGDAKLIDNAYLLEKGGANAASLLKIAQGIVQSVQAKAEAVAKEAYSLAGSQENWDAATAAFNQKADPALRAVVVQMLDSKNTEQIKAAAKLVVEFAKGGGLIPQPGSLIQNFGSAPATGQALSKDEFQAELRKLNPQDRGFAAAREQLYARRQLGKQLGR